MNWHKLKIWFAATYGGSFLFMALVGVSIFTAQFNADTMPNFPWFPVPVLGVVLGVTWWCHRRWDIGLSDPLKAPLGLIVAFAVVSMVAVRALWILEKHYHGVVYEFPRGPEGTSALFLVTYWITISLALSTASEVCFRGIMQAQLARHFGLWSTIFWVVFFNTFSHPWASLGQRFFGTVAILVAWGWLRHISGTLKAPLLLHIAMVMGGDVVFWFIGPVDFGQLTAGTLTAVGAIGLVALAGTIYLSRLITRGAPSAT